MLRLVQSRGRLPAALAAALLLVSCTTVNPATGSRQFTPFMSPQKEARIGAEQHPLLVEQFGGRYEAPRLAGYVTAVGQRLARQAEVPAGQFSFTVLNSGIVNAFALPGGYVHISRGLLALLNDEAELSSVLGHEIGHVTARHAASRYNRAVFSQILGGLLGAVTESETLSRVVSTGSQLYLLSYSRGQEMQSDKLGFRYMTRAEYDAAGAVTMLEALGRQSALEASLQGKKGAEVPGWARTHPLTSERVEAARARYAGLPAGQPAGERGRRRYLEMIDGMIVGDDPDQGVIDGRSFSHPILRIAFEAPPDYQLNNTAAALIGAGPGNARFLFSAAEVTPGTSNREALAAAWRQIGGRTKLPALSGVARVSANGIEGLTGTAQIASGGSSLDLRLVGYRTTARRLDYFLLVTPPAATVPTAPGLQRMTFSFRRLSPQQAARIRPLRIEVVTIRRGQTMASVSERMAYGERRLERFMVLNNLRAAGPFAAGQQVKIVVRR